MYASYLQEDAPLDPLPKAELHYRCLIVDGVDIALGDTVTIEVSLRGRASGLGRNRSSGSRESHFILPQMGTGGLFYPVGHNWTAFCLMAEYAIAIKAQTVLCGGLTPVVNTSHARLPLCCQLSKPEKNPKKS